MPPAERPSQTDDTALSRQYMVHERPLGNTAALFGFLTIGLVAIIGMTIDLSRLTVTRGLLKDRLDAALIAGARETGHLRSDVAEDVFDAMPTGSIARTTARHFEADGAGISGTVSATIPTTLSSVLGIRSIRIIASGRAVAPGRGCAATTMRGTNRPGCTVTVASSTRTAPQN